MANAMFEEMWNILKENFFQINLEVKSEFTCTSCENIMIKACNVPCGCRYCYDCLKTYLNDEEKVCLGDFDDCKRVLINIDKNVFIDQVANMKISRIIAKCPLTSCEFNGELRKMADHMRTCGKQPVACPYYTIGCDKNKFVVDKMKKHFEEENLCHARLLMDFVENWRNEMKLLKTSLLNLQEENKCIKEQMDLKQEKFFALEKNVANLIEERICHKALETQKCRQCKQKKEIISTETLQLKSEKEEQEFLKMKEKYEFLEENQDEIGTVIKELFPKTSERRTDENCETGNDQETTGSFQAISEEQGQGTRRNTDKTEDWKQKIDERNALVEKNQAQMSTKIDKMAQENGSMKTKIDKITQKNGSMKTKIDKITQENGSMKTKIDKITQENGSMKTRIDKMTRQNAETATKWEQSEISMNILSTKVSQIQVNQNWDFLWCIQNWKEKKERAQNGIVTVIFSDHFYSHRYGYKLCLGIYPGGHGAGKKTHLFLFMCIMQGEFDKVLQWPFRSAVKLELLNQITGLPHVTHVVSSERNPNDIYWEKPCTDKNIGIGFDQFIELSELSSNAALFQGNEIWIKATPQIKS